MKLPMIAAWILGILPLTALAVAPMASADVSVGFLPLDWVTSSLKKSLSPEGHYKFLSITGPVQIVDWQEKIEAARLALEELQKAPAVVALDIGFISITSRVVQRATTSPPAQREGIPVPSHYSPPRVIAGPGGSMTVIPSRPIFDAPQKVEPAPAVSLGVPQSETRVTRRFPASVALGKPLSLSIVGKVADPAALRALALKLRAIPPSEPAWPSAGTELFLQSELSEGGLLMKIVPQIVLPAAAPDQPARHIALLGCAGGVVIVRGRAIETGTLPQTDAEFYRLFLGAPQLEKDSLNALRISAAVKYMGEAPK